MNTNMLGRFFEDGLILVRFIYFYARAPKMNSNGIGFAADPRALTVRKRAAWAYNKSTFRI